MKIKASQGIICLISILIFTLFYRCGEDKTSQCPCPAGLVCQDGKCIDPTSDQGGQGSGTLCTPGHKQCLDKNTVKMCDTNGKKYIEYACNQGSTCDNGQCKQYTCTPGATKCLNDYTLQECNQEGSAFVNKDCRNLGSGYFCQLNQCANLCATAAARKNYMGCEYVSIDLDNDNNDTQPSSTVTKPAAQHDHAVVISNTHQTRVANVQVFDNETGKQIANKPVAPSKVATFKLPRKDVEGSNISKKSYTIKSDIPVIAYQFNPLDNVEVYSNDASLLMPTTSAGDTYVTLNWPSYKKGTEERPGFVTIVAVAEGETEITALVKATVKAGNGVPIIQAGKSQNFVLDRWAVLNLETGTDAGDLSGSIIKANKPVVVFSGNECTNIPKTTCCCDHLEQQMFPLNTLGKAYIAAKSKVRGKAGFVEPDLWRIIATEDQTKVELTPTPKEAPAGSKVLKAGEVWEFLATTSFMVNADKPIMVGQFLVGDWYGGQPLLGQKKIEGGDPTYMLAVPVEQFRPDYVFLTPSNYKDDYISIIAPQGAQVMLDGKVVQPSQFKGVGPTKYSVAHIKVMDGTHSIKSNVPVGLQVYGYDSDVSYGFAGGLDLKQINNTIPQF